MCSKSNCYYIEIIEIRNEEKVVIHYDPKGKPVLIQYWKDKTDVSFKPV